MPMDPVLAVRPFVPAEDCPLSKRFYQALGFTPAHEDDTVAILETGSFSFILQNFYVADFADNCMVQLLVRDVDAWWARMGVDKLVADFEVKPPSAPALQCWGLTLGFVFDSSGVLWHVAEAQF